MKGLNQSVIKYARPHKKPEQKYKTWIRNLARRTGDEMATTSENA